MNISRDIGTWVAAFMMLSLFSFLWKENPCSKIAQSIYVGAGAGFFLAQSYKNINDMVVYRFREGQISVLIPTLLGILLFAQLSEKYAYLARFGTALPLGMGAGIALRALPSAQILSQIRATVESLNSINNIVILVGVVTTLFYFLFTVFTDSKNAIVRSSAEIGKYFMMVAFGLTFGTAVFGQISTYLGALQILLGDWLGLM